MNIIIDPSPISTWRMSSSPGSSVPMMTLGCEHQDIEDIGRRRLEKPTCHNWTGAFGSIHKRSVSVIAIGASQITPDGRREAW